jgi:hypothetical protein
VSGFEEIVAGKGWMDGWWSPCGLVVVVRGWESGNRNLVRIRR